MKQLSDIGPFVRLAMPWTYNGSPAEGTRIGYTYAFHLFTEGQGYVQVEHVKHEVEKGTLIFIRPGQVHSFHHKPGYPMESYNIYCDFWAPSHVLNPRFAFHPDPPDLALMTRIEPCPELDMLPVRTSLKPHPYLTELFTQINKTSESEHYAERITTSLMYAFMLRWFNSLHNAGPSDYRIVRIMEEMELHPEYQLRYEEWCAKCGLEKSHFYKLFKQETGMTPKEYLLKMKMKKAIVLLQESKQSITSVSEQLGYDSIHYFSKQFAAYYGMSPSAFRSQNPV